MWKLEKAWEASLEEKTEFGVSMMRAVNVYDEGVGGGTEDVDVMVALNEWERRKEIGKHGCSSVVLGGGRI